MPRFAAAGTLVITLLLGGCLTPAGVVLPDQYLLPSTAEVQPAEKISVSLGVRELDSARPYHLAMAFTADNGKLNYYQTATWAEFPAASLTRGLRDAVLRTGRFADAGMAEQMSRPDWMLVGYLNAFHEDRAATPPQAVAEVRLEMRNVKTAGLLWSATLREVQPIEGTGPAALAKAMDAAVNRLVANAANQIAAVPGPVVP